MAASAIPIPSKIRSPSTWLYLGIGGLYVYLSWWTYRFATSHLHVRDLLIYPEAGRKVLQHADPYQPALIGSGFIYTPVALFLFAPLSRLPDTTAWGVWTILNALAYMGALFLLWRTLQPRRASRPYLVLLILCALFFTPFIEMLYVGQINGLILLGIALFFYATVTKQRTIVGIVALAIAAAVKMSPIVLLGLPAAWKSPRWVIQVLFVALTLAVLAGLVFGPGVWGQFRNAARTIFRSYPQTINQTLPVSVCTHFQRGRCPTLRDWTTFGGIAILALAIAGLFPTPASLRDRAVGSALLITGMVIASPLIWYHHMVFLTIPILVLILGPSYDLPKWTALVGWSALLLIQANRWLEAKLTAGIPAGSVLGYMAVFVALLILNLRRGYAPEPTKTKPRRFPHAVILGVLLAAFVILAMAYSIMIPPGEGVDETPHFDYVRYVKEQRALPVQPLSREQGVKVWMGHHPPLYYILGAIATSWVDTSDSAHVFRPNSHFVWQENADTNGWNVMLHFGQDRFPWKRSILAVNVLRLMTVGLGVVALYAVYRATQLLFPEHPWAPLGATALIGFNPSFIFMSSTVHHDTLQAAIFALAIWWALRFLKGPERRYDTWLVGVLLGAALLTKLSGFVLLPVMALVLFLRARQHQEWHRLPSQTLSLFICAGLVAGWWFIRNQWLYGDPLGWQMFLSIHSHMVRSGPYTWNVFTDEFLGQIGRTFWGAFGYMHITFPEIAKYLWWLTALAGIGLLAGLFRDRSTFRARWPKWIVILTVLLLLFASFARFSIATVGAGHGRYLFPAGVSIAALLIAGLNGFTGWRHQRIISTLVTVGMLVFAVWLPVQFVLPKYDPPETATPSQLAKARPVGAVLAEALELVGYQVNSDLALPGQWLHVELYWRAIGPADERLDPLVRLQVTDDQGKVLAMDTRWPVPSLSPAVWSSETVYVTHMHLETPVEELPPRLHLRVGALPKDGKDYLAAQDASGHSQEGGTIIIGDLLAVGAVTEIAPDVVPNHRSEVFASTLALRGFELPTAAVSPGDVVSVGLYWHVLARPAADYTVFIHVLDDRGELITQFDRPPGGGTVPTSTWQPGQTLRDTYPLPIPSDAPAGTFTVRVGMYTWPSLERLSVSVDGELVGDSVDLGSIQIQP